MTAARRGQKGGVAAAAVCMEGGEGGKFLRNMGKGRKHFRLSHGRREREGEGVGGYVRITTLSFLVVYFELSLLSNTLISE